MTFLFLPPLSNLFHCRCHDFLHLKTPKQVFLNPINIFDIFYTLYLLFLQFTFFVLTFKNIFTVKDTQKVPGSWAYNSKKKGYKRYYPDEVLVWKERLVLIHEGIEECQADRLRVLFRTFSRHHQTWKTALRCIARLDALVSLSVASEDIRQGADGVSDQPTCRPEFVEGGAVLELRNARHPCIAATFSGNGFIPNDTILGEYSKRMERASRNGSTVVDISMIPPSF